MAVVVAEVVVVGGLTQMVVLVVAVAAVAEVVVVVEVTLMVGGVITRTPITNQEAIITIGEEVVVVGQSVVVPCITGKEVLKALHLQVELDLNGLNRFGGFDTKFGVDWYLNARGGCQM